MLPVDRHDVLLCHLAVTNAPHGAIRYLDHNYVLNLNYRSRNELLTYDFFFLSLSLSTDNIFQLFVYVDYDFFLGRALFWAKILRYFKNYYYVCV